MSDPARKSTFGFCASCKKEHVLPVGRADDACRRLMKSLEKHRRIDFASEYSDPRFSTDSLFGAARGQMFGVLECMNNAGEPVFLQAFSCQFNSCWEVAGWAPPLFDVGAYLRAVNPVDKEIKAIGRRMGQLLKESEEFLRLRNKRKKLSRELMVKLHSLYRVTNFRAQTVSLSDAFRYDKGIPTGTGDCCAPKLLNQAAVLGLKPVGLAEFFWGKENRSGTRQHGQFYPCCIEKCRPILGFMLCGLSER